MEENFLEGCTAHSQQLLLQYAHLEDLPELAQQLLHQTDVEMTNAVSCWKERCTLCTAVPHVASVACLAGVHTRAHFLRINKQSSACSMYANTQYSATVLVNLRPGATALMVIQVGMLSTSYQVVLQCLLRQQVLLWLVQELLGSGSALDLELLLMRYCITRRNPLSSIAAIEEALIVVC